MPSKTVRGPREAGASQQRRAQARLRGPARVHALGPAAVGQVLDDAGRHGAGDAQRVGELLLIESQRRADAGRSGHGAEHGGRVETRLVHRFRHDQAQPADGLHANGDAEQRRGA